MMRYIISFLMASLTTTLPALWLPAQAAVPLVVADIPPVHALAAQVMGDLGQPDLLLDKGASEHDFQMRPSQAARLARAGLIIWAGPELTPWLDRAVHSLGEGAPSLALLDAAGTQLQPYAGGVETPAPDTHAEGHDHNHGDIDPHAWLNPENAKIWLGLIADRLGQIDPENAARYQANAATAASDIDTLDAELAAILASAKSTPLVMAHAAYGYLATRYGLTLLGSVALGDATVPGAARLSALQATVAGETSVCLFPEPQHDPALLLQLAETTGAQIGGPLDPVGSDLPPGRGAYASLMRGLAETIAECAAR